MISWQRLNSIASWYSMNVRMIANIIATVFINLLPVFDSMLIKFLWQYDRSLARCGIRDKNIYNGNICKHMNAFHVNVISLLKKILFICIRTHIIVRWGLIINKFLQTIQTKFIFILRGYSLSTYTNHFCIF